MVAQQVNDLIEERAKLFTSNNKINDAVGESESGVMDGEQTQQWEKQYAQIDVLTTRIDQLDRQARHSDLMTKARPRQTDALAPRETTGGQQGLGLDKGNVLPENAPLEINGNVIDPEHPAYAALAERAGPEYQAAFRRFLDTGEIGAVLKTTDDSAGGSFTTTQMLSRLLKFMDDDVFMRSLATVLPPLRRAISLGVPTLETDPNDADWTPEVPASDISEDTNMTTGKRELVPHLNSKLIKISMKLLRASVIPMENLVTDRIAYKHATSEENAFVTGDGNEKPLGVFVASDDGISTSRDVNGNGNATTVHGDDFSDMLMNLKPQYRRNATWLLHRDFVKKAMQIKDNNGAYLWQPGLQQGLPNVILDRPYVESEFVPNTFTNGAYVAILADFKRGYWIVDSLGFSIQRFTELFGLKNQIGFLGRKETDGMPVLEEAFTRLKMTT